MARSRIGAWTAIAACDVMRDANDRPSSASEVTLVMSEVCRGRPSAVFDEGAWRKHVGLMDVLLVKRV